MTGSVAKVRKPERPAPPRVQGSEEPEGMPGEPAEREEEEEEEGPGSRKRLIIIGGAISIIAVAAVLAVTFLLPRKASATPPPEQPGTVQAEPGGEEPDAMQVLKVKRTLLPGQTITLDDIEAVDISAAVFNNYAAFGQNLYTGEVCDYLVGAYANGYIPEGNYLMLEDVGALLPFGANPWMNSAYGYTTLTVPLDDRAKEDQLLTYGAYLDLDVKKTTTNQVTVSDPKGPETETPVAGVTHTTTVNETPTVDEFTVGGLIVCDILNADGESIYTRYSSFIGVPLGNRYDTIRQALTEDAALRDKLAPSYIVVKVTNEQAESIGDLYAENTTVSVKPKASMAMDSTERYQFANEALNVRNTIDRAIVDIDQQAAEEEAARLQAAEEALKKEAKQETQENS